MIIGLCGYARSGKDTLARTLVEEWSFTRYAFADVLKESVLLIDPWVPQDFGKIRLSVLVSQYGWEAAKEYPEVRSLLQRTGTGLRRTLGPDVWLNEVRARIYRENPIHAVITDVRFPNEAEWIRRTGQLVRITRPEVGPANEHVSETAIDDVPAYEVVNDGGLADLQRIARYLPRHLAGVAV